MTHALWRRDRAPSQSTTAAVPLCRSPTGLGPPASGSAHHQVPFSGQAPSRTWQKLSIDVACELQKREIKKKKQFLFYRVSPMNSVNSGSATRQP